jgi:hypothetical protein
MRQQCMQEWRKIRQQLKQSEKNSLRKMGDDKNASAKYSNDSMIKMDGVSNTSAINTGNIETRNNGDINMTLLLPLQLLLATRKETRIKTKQHQQKLNI